MVGPLNEKEQSVKPSEDAPARRALVVTVSDRVAAGTRADQSGDWLAERLTQLGFGVDRALVPDEVPLIKARLERSDGYALVITTGGTGLTPRDVTPQATRPVLDYEVPGLAELMRSYGARSTPNSYLSRSVVGVRKGCLIVNMPGSRGGALDSLTALEPVLEHALTSLAGPFDHDAKGAPSRS